VNDPQNQHDEEQVPGGKSEHGQPHSADIAARAAAWSGSMSSAC
jgi:hypothetical protein